MAADQETVRAALESIIDAPPETIASVAMLTVAALAQAWKTYNERPPQKRIGRRGSDLDCERMERSQAKIEKDLEELSGEVKVLAAILARLEAREAAPAPP